MNRWTREQDLSVLYLRWKYGHPLKAAFMAIHPGDLCILQILIQSIVGPVPIDTACSGMPHLQHAPAAVRLDNCIAIPGNDGNEYAAAPGCREPAVSGEPEPHHRFP